jgi:hypothetical protein
MANKLKEAIERNRVAAQELDQALRDCLRAIKDKPDNVVEGRFRLISGGRRAAGRAARG